MIRKWIEQIVDETVVDRLCLESDLPRPMLRLLIQRGLTDRDAMDGFLFPRLSQLSDPMLLPGMPAAVDRIWQAIHTGERITVYGDYDVDGLTSTALLTRVLQDLGAQVTTFLPEREDDGYGLQVETLRKCVQTRQCSLLVTVDCGTGAVEAVEAATALGVDVVITDHHVPGPHPAPAVATVNPLLGAGGEPWQFLAGVGVAFKLCHALRKQGRENGIPAAEACDLRLFMDLVALGTIADMVPLTGENRILARHGLRRMANSAWPGVQALLAVVRAAPPLTSYHVGFQLGPRLNAAGRMGLAQRGLALLLTDDPAEASALAAELNTENIARQQVEKETLNKALADLETRGDPATDHAVVAAGHDWHAGVIGIVASRLTRKFHRPAVVVALDGEGGGRGSCRSIPGFNMVDALGDCAAELRRFGGHRMAAGLEVEEARLPAFIQAFQDTARNRLTAEDLVPTLKFDSWVELHEVDTPLFEAQELLHPTGQENPGPIWAVRGVRMQQPFKVGENHLKCEVVIGNTKRSAIGFSLWEEAITDQPVDIAFRLQKNEYRDRITYELNMLDYRVTVDT